MNAAQNASQKEGRFLKFGMVQPSEYPRPGLSRMEFSLVFSIRR
jgi:hypothetical protein